MSWVNALYGAWSGLLWVVRFGVIPAALPAWSFLTARFCDANPGATVSIRSLTSRAIAEGLDAFELDGGLTYLENEPIENVRRVSLYRERYKLAVPANHKYARRKAVSWLEAAGEQLCLLSPDMQNRRIIDRLTSR